MAAAPGKKRKKKGEEEAQEVIIQNPMCHELIQLHTQEENEREVPISEMDLFGQPAMDNAYLICHNVQVSGC